MKIKTCLYCKKEFTVQSKKQKYCCLNHYYLDKPNQKINLSSNDIQLILSGFFGDGCIFKHKKVKSHHIHFSSISKKYLRKKRLFGSDALISHAYDISSTMNMGYKKRRIYQFNTKSHPKITEILHWPIKQKLENLSELGLGLWFYDDGSLHQRKKFYHLYTNSFTIEENKIMIEYFQNAWGILAKLRFDRKKDGRCFPYLYFGVSVGEQINKWLKTCSGHELDYKMLTGPTTILQGSRIQENSKHEESVQAD